jgi:DNA-binding PucR family transcriptional regulator
VRELFPAAGRLQPAVEDRLSDAVVDRADRRNGALLETLRAYLDSDLDVGRTAEALWVHPNTVRYRLRRISDLTGLDTQSFSGMVELLTIARVTEASATD